MHFLKPKQMAKCCLPGPLNGNDCKPDCGNRVINIQNVDFNKTKNILIMVI